MTEFEPLTGEPLAIDLINTRARLPGVGWVDALASLSGLRLWVNLQQSRLDVGGGRLTRSDLAAIHRLRDDVADAVARIRQGRRPSAATLTAINDALQASPPTARLGWTADGLAYASRRPGGPGARLLAQLAEAAAELLVDPRASDIRDCGLADCVMIFYPSRPSRKWCCDAICGNRARVARHYRRTRAAQAEWDSLPA